MSQAINKEDIISGSPFKDIADEMQVALTTLEKFDAKIVNIASHLQKDLVASNQKTLQSIEAVNKAEIEAEKLLQAKLKTQQAELKLQEQLRVAQEKTQKAHLQAEKQYNKEIQQAEKANSVYSKVDKKLADMVKRYRDLAIRKEIGAKLTDKEAKDMDFLAKKISYYDTALKNVDATSGKFQRNVGNYASGFSSMNWSVTQLAREMPAFANSVQTGFMAISNNLPMFFDEIQKLKQANIELVKSGEAPKSVFKSLASSILSTQVLLSVGVTLLTLYGAKLVEWGSSLFKVNKEADEHAKKQAYINKQRKESSDFVAKESAEFIGNINALRKTNEGSKERSKMISEINEKYGTTLKNLKNEKEFTDQLNTAVGNYLELQIEKYRQQQNEQKIITNLQTQDKLNYNIQQNKKAQLALEKEIELTRKKANSASTFVSETKIYSDSDKLLKKLGELEQQYKDNEKAIESDSEALEKAKKRLITYDVDITDDTKATKENTTERYKQIDSLKKIQIEFEKTKSIVVDYSQILNDIENIRIDARLRMLEESINEEIEMELEKARKTGKYETEYLNELYARKRDIQIAQIDQQTKFELDQIKKKNEQEYLLEVEQNNKMHQQNRDSIFKQYDEEKKSIKDQLDQIAHDEKLDANEKKRRRQILNQQLLDLEKDFNDKKLVLEDKYNASKDTIESNKAKREQTYKNEEVKATEQANEKKAESNKEYFDATNETNKKLADEANKYQKEMFDFAQQIQEAITDTLKQQIDKRIALLQKESDFAKSQQDYLQNLAAQGNIFAQQSIAEQIKIQRDAQEEQMRLEKQNLDIISTGLKTFEGEISKGKSPAEALATTLATTKTLVQLLSNLNFFAKGTDNAPEGYAVTDEQGAELHLDKNGNIKDFGSTKGAQLKYLERGDQIITASKTAQLFSDISNANKMAKVKDTSGNSYDLKPLLQEMQGMRNDIKNNATQIKVHWDTMGNIIEQVTKGNNRVTNRYRVK